MKRVLFLTMILAIVLLVGTYLCPQGIYNTVGAEDIDESYLGEKVHIQPKLHYDGNDSLYFMGVEYITPSGRFSFFIDSIQNMEYYYMVYVDDFGTRYAFKDVINCGKVQHVMGTVYTLYDNWENPVGVYVEVDQWR